MAEKDRRFEDHGAAERLISSQGPREHKCIGPGVHSFYSAIWDHVREEAVLAGAFAISTQNPAMKQHQLSPGTENLFEASLFDPVKGIGLEADDPEAQYPSRWRGKHLSGKLFPPFVTPFAQGRPGWHTPPPLIHCALRPRPTEFM